MNNTNKRLIYITIILSLLIIFFIFINNNYNNFINYILNKYSSKPDTCYVTKVDTLWNDTTIYKDKLIPKYIYVTKVDTFYKKDGTDTIFKTENKLFQDTLICEKDTAILQIFTSGIKNNVDSISLNLKKSEIVITNTVTVTKYIEKQKTLWDRVSFGPSITTGYDPINHQWGMMIGGSVTFNLK